MITPTKKQGEKGYEGRMSDDKLKTLFLPNPTISIHLNHNTQLPSNTPHQWNYSQKNGCNLSRVCLKHLQRLPTLDKQLKLSW